LRRLALFLGLVLTAVEAAAQVSGSVTLMSDNRFRGISLSDRRPALQGEIAYDHASGLYAGAVASTVRIEGADSSLSAEAYTGYFYPDSASFGSYNYGEVYVGGALERVYARLHYSDDYFGRDVRTLYAEINGSLDLSDTFGLVAHVGCLERLDQGPARPGSAPSTQWDARIGLVTELAGLNLSLSVVGTNVPRSRCPGAYGACAPGVVLAISRAF
jgi:hypothetical protein